MPARGCSRGRSRGGALGRARRGERGSILFEAALVIPLLMFLVFGVIEVGGLLKTYSTTANSVRAGGRMASVAGNDASADQQILARMSQEAGGFNRGEVQWIIVWHAQGPDSSVPSACTSLADTLTSANPSSQGVTETVNGFGACNIYARPQASGGAFDMASGRAANPATYYFGCSGASDAGAGHKVDCRWPGQDRQVTISPRRLPTGTPESARLVPDYVGITMKVEHQYLTGILGDTRIINDTSINLLEPSNFGVNS